MQGSKFGKAKRYMSDKGERLILLEISKKLDILIRLSALNLVKDIKMQKDQIVMLSDAGFQPKEIADVLRTSRNTVNVTLSNIRKARERREVEGDSLQRSQIQSQDEEAVGAKTSEG